MKKNKLIDTFRKFERLKSKEKQSNYKL